MDDKIREKLDKLILKALEDNRFDQASNLLNMRATVAHIQNMEKR